MTERRLYAVPRTVLVVLAVAILAQVGLGMSRPRPSSSTEELPAPPPQQIVTLIAGGDAVPLGKLIMLYLQSFDQRADNRIAYQAMDYSRLAQWLDLVMALDPVGQYPLHAASRLYAEVPNAEKQRLMLEFVHRRFLEDPSRRWPWQAHATAVAKHQLKDLPLARRFAEALQRHATHPGVPPWAQQMEAFILEDMNELETARIMIGGFVQSGRVTDPAELRFLEKRLEEISARIARQESKARQ